MKPKSLKFKIVIFLVLFTTFYVLYSDSAFAAPSWWPLVPCGLKAQPEGKLVSEWNYVRDCTRCDAFKLAKNIIDFVLIGIVPPLGAILFIIGGLMILLGGANPNLIAKGKTVFWNTFIGLIIIFGAWIVANTIIKSFGPDQIKDSWFRFTCKAAIEETEIIGPISPLCSQPQLLAQQYNTAFPYNQNAPELNALVSCINSRLGQFIDQSQLYTYERNNTLCNYTRGNPICGACKHAVNSCHYGGPIGTQGPLAVDFNARVISEQELFNRLNAIRNECNFGFILFEGDHTHVSTPGCAGDTGGN